ncbi:beta-galactosidase family protein [Paraflavitalea sp. CAU 1676]|uniref:glycoside hydrolase family 35 protein n=1 Tax=Paraflavitalea sp. CAU 1676 TaxID=3032598 RepID=UPI0023DC7CB3|nr:beta-galactosidase family protein [Paraflavitalea sp. CAU 1676]MDF2192461.1 beta-galactosidase [Paraflavitalea sp. CAU 1676]
MRKWIVIVTVFLLMHQWVSAQATHDFKYGDEHFLLDGKPFQMISGEIHYPRVPREAWRHRMKMAKAMGINTIGTYVFWNVHEPQQGVYDFAGNHDIAAFVKIAREEGLWVVLRPSPYVCAEWEFGGYPYWLQNIKGLKVRSTEPQYLAAYKNYIQQVGKQLAPYLVTHGGNIVMVQFENEYGSYGADKEYLSINQQMFVDAGFDCLLYTCDPAKDVAKGYLPGFLPAVNGLDRPEQVKGLVRKYHDGKGPFFVAEWYPAWFDWWGEKHHRVPAEDYSGKLDELLGAGLSINMYMFHGGTTRGYMNGANCYDTSFYEPQISSYDYDAPLDEAGNATQKFLEFRKVIQKNLPVGQSLPEVPAAKPSITLPAIKFTNATDLFSVLPAPVKSARPLTFEALKQAYGFVLYRTLQPGGRKGMLSIKELRDYGIVFINGKRVGVLDRRKKQDSLEVDLPSGTATIDILVENMGRINFGPNLLKNEKGITSRVSLNGMELLGWQMYSLPFEGVNKLSFAKPVKIKEAPVLRKGVFELAATGDTYLDMRQWGKGCVWINGHHLGRYWSIGPQQTLYVPAEWLKKGKNEVVVLELLTPGQTELTGLSKPVLDVLAPGNGVQ